MHLLFGNEQAVSFFTITRSRLLLAGAFLLGTLAFAGSKGDQATARLKSPVRNLVRNGDFELSGKNAHPKFWEPIARGGISVIDTGTSHGHVLKFRLSRQVARSTGLMYFSAPIPVTQGKTYRFRADIKSEGPAVIVFLKGYARFRGKEREIYRRKRESLLAKGRWGTLEHTFAPRSPRGQKVLRHRGLAVPIVNYVRVEFFAYGKQGSVYFDNVSIMEESTANQKQAPKQETRSAESGEGKSP